MLAHHFVRAACLAVAVAAAASGARAADIELVRPWIRATPAGVATAGGFVEIRNVGAEADRLIGGSADFAGKVEIHEMTMDGEVMRMRALKDGLAIPAGGEVTLKPGSYHVMFMKLAHPLKAGDSLVGTLSFARAGQVAVTWQVEKVDALAPAGMPSSEHGGMAMPAGDMGN